MRLDKPETAGLRHNKGGLHNGVSAVVLAVLVGMTMWVGHAVRLAKVPSKSMAPTLMPGDVMVMRVDAYHKHMPKRGDIIIFRDSGDGGLVVKRVVGLPGEQVSVWSDTVWINGQRLVEPYARGQLRMDIPEQVVLGKHEVWVMGDNRGHSMDSRDFGPVTQEQMVGRASAIIWPLSRRGRFIPPDVTVSTASPSGHSPS